MADDGPPLLRPTPRRPFNLNFTNATPPDTEQERSTSPSPNPGALTPSGLSASRFLSVNGGFPSPDAGASISRPSSYMNLTSPTLFGIYSPTLSSSARDEYDESTTPWGTGAQTPIRRPSVDLATYEFMRDRSHAKRRRSSIRPVDSRPRLFDMSALSLTLRAALLFFLGVGYGVLVMHFQSDQKHPISTLHDDPARSGANWAALLCWGVAGIVLGALLPWFDKFWEERLGSDQSDGAAVTDSDGDVGKEQAGPGTDWTLVFRAIGAFVGIVYAIRKLSWASTLQVSMTLALANPLLWWIIDRSQTGLILSTAVGFAGSLLLLGVNPDIMPAPSQHPFARNATAASLHYPVGTPDDVSAAFPPVVFGANQQTVEAGVWMLSVLFCSCVCFGNIGRRLAWSRTAVGRGRWGGS